MNMVPMTRHPAERGEILRDVLITQNHPEWLAFERLARARGTSRSKMIRRYVRWELKRARKRGELKRADV